ncbi:hypothetical protein ATANTOWER_028688 [Ataeniobius toweri]|uniref:Uncharacterized protein n=1 Tax=Ataeniobius toweri TaxID=208326 RepID=A0ABU7ADD1_9TELE|nr:hypothetical protein [Ataeniobius toweri]
MVLDCGRKLEYPERTHACKLHAEKPTARSRTKDLLAAGRSLNLVRAAPPCSSYKIQYNSIFFYIYCAIHNTCHLKSIQSSHTDFKSGTYIPINPNYQNVQSGSVYYTNWLKVFLSKETQQIALSQ